MLEDICTHKSKISMINCRMQEWKRQKIFEETQDTADKTLFTETIFFYVEMKLWC